MAPRQTQSRYALKTFQFENLRFSVENCIIHDDHRDQMLFSNCRVQMVRTDLHTHKSVEIFGVLKGHIDITIDDKSLCLSQRDVIVIAPNVPHRAHMETASDYLMLNTRCFFEHIPVDTAMDLYGFFSGELQDSRYYLRRDSAVAANAFERILRYSCRNEQQFFFGACMYEILLDLYATCGSAIGVHRPLRLNNNSERINALDHLLTEYYMKSYSAERLAETLSMSRRQLERFIKKQYGMPLRSLITQRRIDAAQRMLRSTDKTIQTIAADVGYTTLCCFYNAFRKITGMTPAQYRQRRREAQQI